METNKENISRQDSPKNNICFSKNVFKEGINSTNKDFFHPKREKEIK